MNVSQRNKIKNLFELLARHADVLARAFDGPVSSNQKQSDAAAINALFAEGVLKPHAEGSYFLHPRLREFLADVLLSYQAFEALRSVTGIVRQTGAQWEEMRKLKHDGKDTEALYFALEVSIADIVYSFEHNLRMLHALISTQYGNVPDFDSKLRQNKYYLKQINKFLTESKHIRSFVNNMVNEAIVSGILEVRRLVLKQIDSRILKWIEQIEEAQKAIDFKIRRMEESVRRLSRYALWLQRAPSQSGWDIALDRNMPDYLVRQTGIGFRPQPDVADASEQTNAVLRELAAKLPPPSVQKKPRTEGPQPQYLVEEGNRIIIEQVDPVSESLHKLIAEVRGKQQSMSLIEWKRCQPALAELSDEDWLFWAAVQIKAEGLPIKFLTHNDDPFSINICFYDIMVLPPRK